MFDGDRYITSGIQAQIGLGIQNVIWCMIDVLRKESIDLDYIQVFKLYIQKNGNTSRQRVVHEQKISNYTRMYTFPCTNPVCAKVFVISSTDKDGKDYSTMLLAEEL